MSAHPVGQASTVISNVLGGIGKIVRIVIGGGGPFAAASEADCPDGDDNPGHQIKIYKDQILSVQVKLAGDNVSDTQQKQYTAQLQALQTLLQQEQAKMSFAIKATIDPGYTDPQKVQVGSDAPPAVPFPSQPPPGSPKLGAVPQNGLIASLIPTAAQMKGVPWIKILFLIRSFPNLKSACIWISKTLFPQNKRTVTTIFQRRSGAIPMRLHTATSRTFPF